MRLRKSTYFLLLFICFVSNTIAANKPFGDEEKQAITNAINKYLDAAGIKLNNLSVKGNATGGKTASGKVSFFGFDDIALKAELTSDKKVKNISTIFPSDAAISTNKLTKFLSGNSLNSFLPKSFPLDLNIYIKDFELEFDDKGDSLSKFATNFGIGNYSIGGFNGFMINTLHIGFILDKPTSQQRVASATINGGAMLGTIPINLHANISSDPDALLFAFTASNIGITSILKSFMNETKANGLLKFIPATFISKEISSITATINPINKNFSAIATTSFGEAEIQFNGANEAPNASMLFAIAPPEGFRFSQLASSLSAMDNIELSGTALVISTVPNNDVKINLKALNGADKVTVVPGLNIYSNIKFKEDLAKLLKVNQLKLRGNINETFTNLGMQASLDLAIPMGENITMKDVFFGLKLGTVNPIEFNVGGKIEAKVGDDLLGLNAVFAFSPTDQQISGELFLAALSRKTGVKLTGKLDSERKSDMPEWTNPFGIPGVGLRKLGVSAGLDFKNPILISSLGFTGAARLGTVSNRAKHIEGDATIVVNITNPTKSLIDISMKNMTILSMIEAFVENANIQGQLRTILNSGIDEGKVLVVPVDGMVAFGKVYQKGIVVNAMLSLAGVKALGAFAINENTVSGAGEIDPIDWGNGAFQLKGRTKDKAQFNFNISKSVAPAVFIDGKISLLGLSSETTLQVNEKGFEFTTSGKIANAFEATLEGKGSITENNKGVYVRAALRNDLISQLNQMVTGKINEAIQTTKNTLQATRNQLAAANNELATIDKAIQQRTFALQGQKAAEQQKFRDEAIRAMNERAAFIKTCEENNASSQRKINELPDWRFVEKAAYYTAITSNNAAIESARVAYNGYLATVKSTSDVVQAFPNDPELIRLLLEKQTKQAGLAIASAGVDVAEGVSITTLETTKYVMDKSLGGVFDLRSAEFSGTFGLNDTYKVNASINFDLAKKPYNMVTEIDFKDIASSASKIAGDVLAGRIINEGYTKTFANELKTPISNIPLYAASKTINTTNNPGNIQVVKPITNVQLGDAGIAVNNTGNNEWDNKFFRIENLWRSGQRINIEHGPLVSTVMFDGAWSAQWIIKPVPGSNYFWIENKWKGGRLNIENDTLECSVIQEGAWSAQWQLSKIGTDLYRIENHWKPTRRIHVEKDVLECNEISDGANSAMWYIRQVL